MFTDQVERGAAFLDLQFGGDWPTKIDLERLSMVDYHNCVVGQLYGEYGYVYGTWQFSPEQSESHGFTILNSLSPLKLTQEWWQLIKRRLT